MNNLTLALNKFESFASRFKKDQKARIFTKRHNEVLYVGIQWNEDMDALNIVGNNSRGMNYYDYYQCNRMVASRTNGWETLRAGHQESLWEFHHAKGYPSSIHVSETQIILLRSDIRVAEYWLAEELGLLLTVHWKFSCWRSTIQNIRE